MGTCLGLLALSSTLQTYAEFFFCKNKVNNTQFTENLSLEVLGIDWCCWAQITYCWAIGSDVHDAQDRWWHELIQEPMMSSEMILSNECCVRSSLDIKCLLYLLVQLKKIDHLWDREPKLVMIGMLQNRFAVTVWNFHCYKGKKWLQINSDHWSTSVGDKLLRAVWPTIFFELF